MKLTEEEWLTGTDARRLVECFPGGLTERRIGLFVAAACRPLAPHVPDGLGGRTLDAVERLADALTGEHVWAGELERRDPELVALTAALDARFGHASVFGYDGAGHSDDPALVAASAVRLAAHHLGYFRCHAFRYLGAPLRQIARVSALAGRVEGCEAELADLVREVAGNPFRPAALDPAWRTTDVLFLARGITAERAFDRMPILADALQDAGCDCDDILAHCRDLKRVHVRGCWVVDLALGK